MGKIYRNVYRNSSEIAQCDDCNWTDDGTKKARQHTLKTGHITSCETNIVYYYSLSSENPLK